MQHEWFNKYRDRITFLAKFSYKGENFFGVQEQPGLPTVLGTLRKIIEKSAGQRACALSVTARTDRGVHAIENFATFYLKNNIDVKKFLQKMNSHDDSELFSLEITMVDHQIHARSISRGKIYRYSIFDAQKNCDLFQHEYAWGIAPRLNLPSMRSGAMKLIGEKDFKSFQGGGCSAGTTIKNIFYIKIIRTKNSQIFIEICGNSFLRKMVRNIVGFLVEVGCGLRSPSQVEQVIEGKNRALAGIMAPAHGLCLLKILR